MVKIKICGITELKDALLCVNYGADALGFVFYNRSPRYAPVESVRRICRKLPSSPEKIGVFVDESAEKILSCVQEAGLTAVQLHGKETPGQCAFLASRVKVIKAFAVANPEDPLQALDYTGVLFLFDTKTVGFGGSGKTFPWEYLMPYKDRLGEYILSGGLTPDNVVQAIDLAQPAMVDVSSGVEASAGKKDPAKVKAFIDAVRNTGDSPSPYSGQADSV